MFQRNVTHIHGDVIAQQDNLDIQMVEHNVMYLGEQRYETALNNMQQTVVNIETVQKIATNMW